MKQRPAGLFAALILLASTPSAFAQAAAVAAQSKPSPAAQAEIDRILAADMDGYLAAARQNFASAPSAVHAIAISVDDIAAGNPNAAAATIAALPARRKAMAADLLDMWIALARDDNHRAVDEALRPRQQLAGSEAGRVMRSVGACVCAAQPTPAT